MSDFVARCFCGALRPSVACAVDECEDRGAVLVCEIAEVRCDSTCGTEPVIVCEDDSECDSWTVEACGFDGCDVDVEWCVVFCDSFEDFLYESLFSC